MQKISWGPVWFAGFVLVVIMLGTLLHKPAPAATHDQTIAEMQRLEAWHCEMTGHPSREAELAGYVCP